VKESESAVERTADVLGHLFRSLMAALPTDVAGVGRVTREQYGVLAHLLASGASGMGEIATARAISLSGATALVDRLEQAGLVTRDLWPEDRRVVRADLTAAGRKLVLPLRAARRRRLAELLLQLDPGQRAALLAALPALEALAVAARTGAGRR